MNLIFGFENFNEGQYETIERTLMMKDSIVLLPTGAGKSVTYQLSSFLLPGISLVICPLLSLMKDQIENLKSKGIDRANFIGSTALKEDNVKIQELFTSGEYGLFYVSPERLQIEAFRESLRIIRFLYAIPLVAIDEAHCISEWGHDFRTAYLNIGNNSRKYCGTRNGKTTISALTGTASSVVIKDIKRELEINDFDAIITPNKFDRNEISFSIVSCDSQRKKDFLINILKNHLPTKFGSSYPMFFQTNDRSSSINTGILFCPHTSGDFGVYYLRNYIASSLALPVEFFSGKKPNELKNIANEEWNQMKEDNATKFKNDGISLLVATKA